MQLELVFDDLGDFAQAYRGRISVDGMLVFCSAPLPSGTVIDLSIALRDGLVLIRGRGGVLRTSLSSHSNHSERELHTAALRFVELDEDSIALIQRMEERHESEGVRPFDLEESLAHWGRESGLEHDCVGRPVPTTRLEESSTASELIDQAEAHTSRDAQPPQRPHEVYDMVTAALDEEQIRSSVAAPVSDDADSPRAAAKPRFARTLTLPAAALLVAAIVVFVALRFFPEIFTPRGVSPVVAPPRPTSSATPATEATTAAVPEPSPTSLEVATPTQIAVTPRQTPPAAARGVTGLSWQEHAGGTTLSILMDGALSPDRLHHFRLTDQPGPRHVVQILDITHSELAYTTRVMSPQVTTIRAWHHSDKKPPALHVVVDLATAAVELGRIAVEEDRIVLELVSAASGRRPIPASEATPRGRPQRP